MFDRWQYRFLYWYSVVLRWVKTRFTPAGRFVLLGLVVSASLGWTPNKTLAYQIFTFLAVMLVVAFLFSFFFKPPIEARRNMPRVACVGQPLTYPCYFENRNGETQEGLTFTEQLDRTKPSMDHFVSLSPPLIDKQSRVDFLLQRDKLRARCFTESKVEMEEQPLPALSSHKTVQVPMTFTPLKRGYLRMEGIGIQRTDPLGLYRAIASVPSKQSILILPKMYRVRPIQLAGSRKHNQSGVALASNIGESEEFVALRDYRAGDPLRTIHWKSWAKTGKPIVKQYQDEFFSRYALILDTFMDADGTEVFEEAVSVAATFSANIDLGESLLDLMFIGTEAFCFTSGRSLGHTDQMLEILASVKTCKDRPFSVLPELVMSRSSLLSGCICVMLGWDPERRDFIAQMRALNVPLLVCVIQQGDETPDPGPMADDLEHFHVLQVGYIEEALQQI